MNDRQQLIEYQDACRNCAGEQNTQYVVARWSRAYIVFDKCETLPLFGKKPWYHIPAKDQYWQARAATMLEF